MRDARQFPIVPGKPHIFRAGGEWRVYVEQGWVHAGFRWYQRNVIDAHAHTRRLSGLPA